jgi:hypothetical protein
MFVAVLAQAGAAAGYQLFSRRLSYITARRIGWHEDVSQGTCSSASVRYLDLVRRRVSYPLAAK